MHRRNMHVDRLIHVVRRWSYRLLFKDLWHADKKQDRNALAKPLLSILQDVKGGPIVKSKVLHLFR